MGEFKKGMLSDYFQGVAVKRLSAVEADTARSNQHEFNGVSALKDIFGSAEPEKFPALFIWLGKEQEGLSDEGFVTWYDARRSHPKRSEYRLYFEGNAVSELSSEGDFLLIGKRTDGSVLVVVAPKDSTVEQQLAWLFGVQESQLDLEFTVQEIAKENDATIDFAATYILEELQIEIEDPDADKLDQLIAKFKFKFPTTREFSAFARKTLPDAFPIEDPDAALVAWMNHEEALFRRLERQIVGARLIDGFVADGEPDVEGFLEISKSIQNRRKSRAGYALGNHLEAILQANEIRFKREAFTEKRGGADFLFPGQEEYHDSTFTLDRLTMLGVKTSCKDRWRQVLAEADRIPAKHLLTLEPGISETQTAEMERAQLQLVLPQSIHETYKAKQQAWLMNVAEFIALVDERHQQG